MFLVQFQVKDDTDLLLQSAVKDLINNSLLLLSILFYMEFAENGEFHELREQSERLKKLILFVFI